MDKFRRDWDVYENLHGWEAVEDKLKSYSSDGYKIFTVNTYCDPRGVTYHTIVAYKDYPVEEGETDGKNRVDGLDRHPVE